MKTISQRFNPYGLRRKMVLYLASSAILCLGVFFAINTGLDYLYTNHYDRSDFAVLQQKSIQRQYESLQNYIDVHHVSSQDLESLKKWEKKEPVILLELYDGEQCIYSSVYNLPVSILDLKHNTNGEHLFNVKLADKNTTALVYSDFTYHFRVLTTAISIVVALVLFILLFLLSSDRMIRYICRLNEEVQILEGGNLEYCVSEEGNDEITDLARSMNRMRVTLHNQIETEQQLYQANRRLITEMSHDLRTPLTGIMLYLEILRSHRYETEEQLQDYLKKIDEKAYHMKRLSDHLFAYSLQETTEKQPEAKIMEMVFHNVIQNMVDELQARGYSVETDIVWQNCFVQVNEEYLHRIFENIVSNIEKYAEKSAGIRIDTVDAERYCGFSVMNSFTADTSSIESNGVGIKSIRHMMQQMQGICRVEQTDTIYEISLLFPKQ